MPVNVTLYGESAERFREVQEDLADRIGVDPSNAETVTLLMAGFDAEDIGRRDDPVRPR